MKRRIDAKFYFFGGHEILTFGTTSLGSLVVQEPDYGSGAHTVPMTCNKDVRYIRITDFDDEGIPPNHEFVTASAVEDCYRLEENDVLFARSGATVGKTYIHSTKIGPAIFAGYCIRFRFDTSKVLPQFVYHYTKTNRYKLWVQSIQRPSGQPNINKEEFKSFTILLPSLELQRKLIVDIEKARESKKRKLEKADELLNGLDGYVLEKVSIGKPNNNRKLSFAVRLRQIEGPLNPERYQKLRLEDAVKGTSISTIAEILETKITPAQVGPTAEWNWIRIDDLPNQPLGVDTVRTEKGSNIDGTFFEVQEGDILLARLGPTIQNAKFVLCPKTRRKTIASSEFLVLRCHPGWTPLVVLWVLRTAFYREMMYSKARGGTPSRYRLNKDDLSSLPFPIINSENQKSMAQEISKRLDKIRHLRNKAVADWDAAKKRFEQKLLRNEV